MAKKNPDMDKRGGKARRGSRHLQELETLYKISRILAAATAQRQALAEVLDTLDNDLGMNRGTVTLLGPDSAEITIDVAHNVKGGAKPRRVAE